MINPFRPQKYIRVSDVMDMIAELENEKAEVEEWVKQHSSKDKYWTYYPFRRARIQENIDLLRSVLKAKLKP